MKVEFNKQEVSTWIHVLMHHYNNMCELQRDTEYKFHYKMLGILLNQLFLKFRKKELECETKRTVKIDFTDSEMWAFLHTNWEGMNNEYISNLTQTMVNVSHKYFIDITLEPYGNHNLKLLLENGR